MPPEANILYQQACTLEYQHNYKDAIEKVAMTVEGYTCAKIAHRLCLTHNLELPIIEQMYQVLYNNKNPYQALEELLSRPYKFEE